jgi:hypothetical protein
MLILAHVSQESMWRIVFNANNDLNESITYFLEKGLLEIPLSVIACRI